MSIRKLTDKPRTKPFRLRYPGGKVEMFETRKQAELALANFKLIKHQTGLPPSFEERNKITVGQLFERYLKEIVPTKGSAVSQTTVLERLLGINNLKTPRHPICDLTLAQVSTDDGYAYIAGRRKDTWRGEPVKDSTIKREVHTLCRIFNVAKKQWHKQLLRDFENPFAALDHGLTEEGRERRLAEWEYEALLSHCDECRGLNREYNSLAIFLAVETGMRLQEIFNLTWHDVDIKNRRITIRKSKTDYKSKYKGRTIVMSVSARAILGTISVQLIGKHRYSPSARIFPMTREAFKQSWADVVRRAGIEDLHFHDLRHEAGSRFDEAGLTHAEHGLMMGHGKRTMRDRYSHGTSQAIQDKLDKHLLGGKTFDEWFADAKQDATPSDKQFQQIVKRSGEIFIERRTIGEPVTLVEAAEQTKTEMREQLRREAQLESAPNVVALRKKGA